MDASTLKRPLDAAGIAALVHGFYADVRADGQLGPLFDRAIGAHWDAHLARMVDFWSTVMLGAR
ncbi:group III truncated hemoglobin [Alicycliphilus denitrificans]|uniref:group III truncated hemoglobin n=1 Tax=Alicycliphilus denitrificans TaxID=179636 RepID=UPI003A80FAE0